MPACEHCGKIASRIYENNNGRTALRLCPMCQAEYELKQQGSLSPTELARSSGEPWYRRWWRKLSGGS